MEAAYLTHSSVLQTRPTKENCLSSWDWRHQRVFSLSTGIEWTVTHAHTGRVSQCHRSCRFHREFSNNTGVSSGVVSSHIDVSTCSAIVCRPLFSSSIWHLFAMFLNNRGYRVSLCSGATSRSRSWSLRHSSFLSHHWGKPRDSSWEEHTEGQRGGRVVRHQGEGGGWAATGREIWNQNTMSSLTSTYGILTGKVTSGRNGHVPLSGPRIADKSVSPCALWHLAQQCRLRDSNSCDSAQSNPRQWLVSCTFTYIPKSSLSFRLSR